MIESQESEKQIPIDAAPKSDAAKPTDVISVSPDPASGKKAGAGSALPVRQDVSFVKKLVICGLLTALAVVLGGLLSIPAMPLGIYTVKIGLGVLPVMLAAVLFGPVYGGMVGGAADFLQAMIFPKGAYMPWFTVVGVLFGLIPGLFFMKRQEPKFLRLLLAVGVGQLICSVGLNTGLLVWLYGVPFLETITLRAVNQCVMIPIYTLLVYGIVKLLRASKII